MSSLIPRRVLTRWYASVVVSAMLVGVAMMQYPGGTQLDSGTSGYAFTQNFLSDLGTTVAFDGRSNTLGAMCFVLSLVVLLAGALGLLHAVHRVHQRAPRARAWSRAAIGVAVLVCVAFAGVALATEDRDMPKHVLFTLAAFRLAPVVPLLLAIAAFRDPQLPARIGVCWGALTVVLCAYVLELQLAPSTATVSGLTTQVLAQKLVVAGATLVLLVQSVLLSPLGYRPSDPHTDAKTMASS